MTTAPINDAAQDRGAVLKRALIELRDLRARLTAAESTSRVPIAVVGIGCRFPGGANSPEEFWRLLMDGRDVTTEVPAERWSAADYYDADRDAPGKMYSVRGGFIDQVDGFDERFFNIAAREARSMDPQQRILLEVAWEALEHAAVAPDQLQRSRTGVFLGISASDYAHLLTAHTPIEALDGYAGLGTGLSFAAGRLSYLLGLQGPSIALDTACSSSLVAVHLACQSLRSGESDLALCGGVSLILSPGTHIVLCRGKALAPDGRCKTFSAAADGYGRGEGCGMVVLRRLPDALAAGDRILAVIRGSAVNQDGPSSGLTVPSGAAQQSVIRDALAAAGVSPAQVSYVEAHGTGTPLGDPIEVRALAAALGPGRTSPLLIGSAKTNIGHLEASAGIAGLIKTVLAAYHGELPAHLHASLPNPFIDWAALPVEIVQQRRPWPALDKDGSVSAGALPIAGVSAFGASGTNAHVILEAPPPQAAATGSAARTELVAISAKSAEALRALALRYEQHLSSDSLDSLAALAHTTNRGRAHWAHRLALVVDSAAELRKKLAAFSRGEQQAAVAHNQIERSEPPRIVFLFTGQGAQYIGMGKQLFATQPVFRQALTECDALLRPYLPQPLLSVLYTDDKESPLLNDTLYTQPALFAIGWALVALWKSLGIEPAALLGYSVGEYVAACVAGVFTLAEGLRLIATRARLMHELPQGGAMAALFTDEATVAQAICSQSAAVEISALNGPTEIIISGAAPAVALVVAALAEQGVKARTLAVAHAFHSALMEPMLDEFTEAAAEIKLVAPRLPLISSVSGQSVRDDMMQPAYFRQQVRAPVRFSDGIATLHRQGYTLFLEIGPTPTLCGIGRRCVPESSGTFLPSLRQNKEDWGQVLGTLAELYVRGVRIDWNGLYTDQVHRKVALPTYPFQRRRHWLEQLAQGRPTPIAARPAAAAPENPLLGHRLSSPAIAGAVYEAELSAAALPVLRDHRVYGHIVVSGVLHLSLVSAAAAASWELPGGLVFDQIQFLQPLILPEAGPRMIQTILGPAAAGSSTFQLVSCDPAADQTSAQLRERSWTLHTTGQVRKLTGSDARPAARTPAELQAVQERCREQRAGQDFYQRLWRWDDHYLGPSFQVIEHIWRRDGEALTRLQLPPAELVRPPGATIDLNFLLSAAIGEVYGQALMPALPDYEQVALSTDYTYVGQGVDRSWDYAGAAHRARYCHAVLRSFDGVGLCGDVWLLDAAGEVLGLAEGLRVRRVEPALLKHAVKASASRPQRVLISKQELLAGSATERRERLARWVTEQVAVVVGIAAAGIAPVDSLQVLGMDSLMVVELRRAVQLALGVAVPLGELVHGMTLHALTDWLEAELQKSLPAQSSIIE